MQHLMDSFADSTHAGSARPDATDVSDFVIGFLASPNSFGSGEILSSRVSH